MNHNQAPQVELSVEEMRADILPKVAEFASNPDNEFAAGPDIRKGIGLNAEELMAFGGYDSLKNDALAWKAEQDSLAADEAKRAEAAAKEAEYQAGLDEYRNERDAANDRVAKLSYKAMLNNGGRLAIEKDPELAKQLKDQAIEQAATEGLNVSHLQPKVYEVATNEAAEERTSSLAAALKAHDKAMLSAQANKGRTENADAALRQDFDAEATNGKSFDAAADEAVKTVGGTTYTTAETKQARDEMLSGALGDFMGKGEKEGDEATAKKRGKVAQFLAKSAGLLSFGFLKARSKQSAEAASTEAPETVEVKEEQSLADELMTNHPEDEVAKARAKREARKNKDDEQGKGRGRGVAAAAAVAAVALTGALFTGGGNNEEVNNNRGPVASAPEQGGAADDQDPIRNFQTNKVEVDPGVATLEAGSTIWDDTEEKLEDAGTIPRATQHTDEHLAVIAAEKNRILDINGMDEHDATHMPAGSTYRTK